ncbi:hypothetical protein AB0M46_46715 [Dactylosporangium sp. NPDC051485]|uniref:hypothetical protein n=1 Tax=Dactylosporangium sp. NPDC051485 TaxID=3154846 RepID=UPI003445325B
MSETVMLAAAAVIAEPRLREFLDSPVKQAADWPEPDWAGLFAAMPDQSPDELPDAIAECDGWLDGDYATVLRALLDDDELTLRYDEATGSLALDFAGRVDFRLPSLVWACTIARGLAEFMDGEDRGTATITTDWNGAEIVLRLTPGRSEFRRDPEARAEEIDIRAAAEEDWPL